MSKKQNAHFGPDGYKQLFLNQKAAKTNRSTNNLPHMIKIQADQKELFNLRNKDYKRKKTTSRLSKFIVPRGSGHSSSLGAQRK